MSTRGNYSLTKMIGGPLLLTLFYRKRITEGLYGIQFWRTKRGKGLWRMNMKGPTAERVFKHFFVSPKGL